MTNLLQRLNLWCSWLYWQAFRVKQTSLLQVKMPFLYKSYITHHILPWLIPAFKFKEHIQQIRRVLIWLKWVYRNCPWPKDHSGKCCSLHVQISDANNVVVTDRLVLWTKADKDKLYLCIDIYPNKGWLFSATNLQTTSDFSI